MVENILKLCDQQVTCLQNIQAVHVGQHPKNKQPNQKMGKRFKQAFSKGDTDGQEVHERCSTLISIREMHIKTTVRHHLTPVSMTIVKKSTSNKCWKGCGKLREGNSPTLLMVMQIGAATKENIMECPYKTKNRATI